MAQPTTSGRWTYFGHLLPKQRRLLKERDNLISQIQALPGFDRFLTSPLSFDKLCSVASSGPIIIANHSRWHSDILIFLHNMFPSLIPTLHDVYYRARTSYWTRDANTGLTRARWKTRHRPIPSAQSTRSIPHLVVPDIHLLFLSTPCHGSHPHPITARRATS